MNKIIEGIKLIRHNVAGIESPDDPSYPYLLIVHLRQPEFMNFALTLLFGGLEIIYVRGMTKDALEEFAQLNHLINHPRLQKIEIIGP